MSQRHLSGHLRELIDRARRWEGGSSGGELAKYIAALAVLDAMLDLNPHAAASSHVLHNIGRSRRAWLVQHQQARAGAPDATPTPATRSVDA
jgi:hypothetical protein